MDDYLSGFLSYLWKSILQLTDIQSVIGVLIAIAILFVPSLFSLKEWGRKLMKGRFQLFWEKYRWYVVIIILFVVVSNGQYSLFQEKQNQIINIQNEIKTIQEEHRPIITLSPAVTLNPKVDEIYQLADLNIKIKVNNIGDRPAYESYSMLCFAPLDQPQDLKRYDDIYWFAFNINLDDKTTSLNPPSQSTIKEFEPYISKLH
ncbi:hypothetical protein ACFLUP_03115 [Chloroflexota bacterium]